MPSIPDPGAAGAPPPLPDLSDLAGLPQELAARGVACRVWLRPQVASTQDLVVAAARAGEPGGLAVLSDHQLKGRGRAGRSWSAPPGTALMLSMLLRPPAMAGEPSSLALVAGLALAEAVEQVGGPEVRLKWPNDCLVGGRKLAGILVESLQGAGSPALAVGVGCNVRWEGLGAQARPAAGGTALDLEGWRGGRLELTAELLDRLDRRYREWCRAGFAPFREEWLRRAAWLGEQVSVGGTWPQPRGALVGVDQSGAVLLRPGLGPTVAVRAGDLGLEPSLRRRRTGSVAETGSARPGV